MVTDKNKEKFEKWYNMNICIQVLPQDALGMYELEFRLSHFYKSDFRMQIGVCLAYYQSLGFYFDNTGGEISYRYGFNGDRLTENEDIILSYKEAFKAANELINKQ